MDYLNNKLSKEYLTKIQREVAYINENLSLKCKGQIKDEIFSILDKLGTLILYPFEELNLCGIYIFKDEKNYFILNSSLPLEDQVFAAAHEFAHSLDIARVKFEIVTTDLMTEYVNHDEHGKRLENADIIANRFAAEFLVGEKQLEKEYKELSSALSIMQKAVILSDIFLVPYKTIIKRLVEINILVDKEIIDDLLDIDHETLTSMSDRLECRRRNIEINKEIRLGNYINKALTLYEKDLSTYNELKNYLSLLDKTPEEFNIIDDSVNIYDLMNNSDVDFNFEEDYE